MRGQLPTVRTDLLDRPQEHLLSRPTLDAVHEFVDRLFQFLINF